MMFFDDLNGRAHRDGDVAADPEILVKILYQGVGKVSVYGTSRTECFMIADDTTGGE